MKCTVIYIIGQNTDEISRVINSSAFKPYRTKEVKVLDSDNLQQISHHNTGLCTASVLRILLFVEYSLLTDLHTNILNDTFTTSYFIWVYKRRKNIQKHKGHENVTIFNFPEARDKIKIITPHTFVKIGVMKKSLTFY